MTDLVPMFKLFVNEENSIPVYLETSEWPATGITDDNVRVRYSRKSDGGLTNFLPTPSEWSERGEGFYGLTLPEMLCEEIGMLMYLIEPVISGFDKVRGFAFVDKRVEKHLLEAQVTGYDEGTVGDALVSSSSDKFEAFATPSYDFDNGILKIRAWLHRNGLLITTPTSAQVTLKSEAGATIADQVGSSPDADGFFLFTINPQTPDLEATKNYSVRVRVTYQGTEYVSGESWFTLN